MIRRVAAALAGYAAHQTHRWFEMSFNGGLGLLARYAFGVSLVYQFARSIFQSLDGEDDMRRFDLAWWGAFVPFGAGVLIGWIVDRSRGAQ
jgi:membrane associated rhomboid family serine protease